MRVAALDLGSNSFLLTIAEATTKGYTILHDESVVCRLGQGVNQTKKLHPEALERVENCFKKFSQTLNEFKVDQIKAVSTSAARDAENKEEFLKLGDKYNIPIEIISGPMEAELTFKGGTLDFKSTDNIAVVDVGGGSTEIIGSSGAQQINGYSLDIGAVRLTEMFVSAQPITDVELQLMNNFIVDQFKIHEMKLPKKVAKLIAVAGTPTTLACVVNNKPFDESIHQTELSLIELESWASKLAKMNIEERSQLTGMQPGRADVIVAGIYILIETLNFYKLQKLVVSTKGVRFALVQEMLNG